MIICFVFCTFRSRDSSVVAALGYGLDERGSRFRFPAGAGNFSLHHRAQNGAEVHSPFYKISTRGSFSGDEANHSSPSSTDVKE
jgi:hypothetical protein